MKRGIWAGLVTFGFFGATVYGAGLQWYTEGSAEALGQAAAISGRDDLVSLAWYNPAALSGADQAEVMAGAVFLQLKTEFDSDFGPAYDASMDDEWRTIPHLYGVLPVSEDLTALLSVNVPYGLITEWPDNWAGRYAAVYSEFISVYTTPSLAYRINDALSLAAGFNVVYAEAEMEANRAVETADLGIRTVTGDGIGCGGTVSAHGNLGSDWSVGVRYQSRVKLNLKGGVVFEHGVINQPHDARAEIELPSSVNIGLVNRTVDRLQLGMDVVWTEWSTYDELVYEFGRFGPGYVTYFLDKNNPEVISKRWDDVWSIRIGGDYALTDAWDLRAGYVWDQSPVNDSTRSPELPGTDRQMLTAGIGWTSGNFGVDLAYSYLWAKDGDTGSEVVEHVPTSAGSYGSTAQIVGLSARYKF